MPLVAVCAAWAVSWGVSTISYTRFVVSPLLVAGLSGWLSLLPRWPR
ncbi:hypothetical protein [Nonomuraea sp. SYSU D8015]|nr:hypothetical protein [Nonomuraea sp. SYSU D8015]